MIKIGFGPKFLIAGLFMALLWGGITAGPSVAASTLTGMGYTLTDLGNLGGSYSHAIVINDKGQVIG